MSNLFLYPDVVRLLYFSTLFLVIGIYFLTELIRVINKFNVKSVILYLFILFNLLFLYFDILFSITGANK